MLTESKELGIIKRKRKKSFDPSIDKEETKSRSKRSKLNEDSTNQRITDWLVEEKPKRKEKDENRLVERVNKNEKRRNEYWLWIISYKNPFIKK